MSRFRKGAEFLLRKFRNSNEFRIRNDQRQRLESELSCSTDDLLQVLIDVYKEKAVVGISGFHVAAAALGKSGDIYMGVNVETPFANLGHTVHAEQFVIINAHKAKEAGLTRFVVSDFPCGHCRQFLFELPGAHDIVVEVPSKDMKLGLGALLPHSFYGKMLNPDCPTLLSDRPQSNHLHLSSQRKLFAHLEDVALEAANDSFAPYSSCPAGVALELSDGSVFSGSYIESCAFNPSIGPVLSAVVNMICSGEQKERLADTTHAILVETEGAKASSYGSLKEVISKYAPDATMSRIYARPESEEDRRRRHLQYV